METPCCCEREWRDDNRERRDDDLLTSQAMSYGDPHVDSPVEPPSIEEDPFGQALLAAGLGAETVAAWSSGPGVAHAAAAAMRDQLTGKTAFAEQGHAAVLGVTSGRTLPGTLCAWGAWS